MPDSQQKPYIIDDSDIIQMERDGFLTVPSDKLSRRQTYVCGDRSTRIFEAPKVGDYVIVLEHYFSPRHVRQNNWYTMEEEYEKKYIVYKVLEPFVNGNNINNDDSFNRAALEYHIGEITRVRYIEYSYIYCGFYCCLPVTESVKRHMAACRGMADETFEIRRFCKLRGVIYEDVLKADAI